MAVFDWIPVPAWGQCITCGSSVNDRGFVDAISDAPIFEGSEIRGEVHAVFCAPCVEQMGNRVGMASKAETDEFAYREFETQAKLDGLRDEVQAWQSRFDALMSESFTDQVRKSMETASAPTAKS